MTDRDGLLLSWSFVELPHMLPAPKKSFSENKVLQVLRGTPSVSFQADAQRKLHVRYCEYSQYFGCAADAPGNAIIRYFEVRYCLWILGILPVDTPSSAVLVSILGFDTPEHLVREVSTKGSVLVILMVRVFWLLLLLFFSAKTGTWFAVS